MFSSVTDCSIIEAEYRGIFKIKPVPLLRFIIIIIVVLFFILLCFDMRLLPARARLWAGWLGFDFSQEQEFFLLLCVHQLCNPSSSCAVGSGDNSPKDKVAVVWIWAVSYIYIYIAEVKYMWCDMPFPYMALYFVKQRDKMEWQGA